MDDRIERSCMATRSLPELLGAPLHRWGTPKRLDPLQLILAGKDQPIAANQVAHFG